MSKLSCLIAATIAVTAALPPAGAQERERRGREIAEDACSPCHAIGRQGASPNVASPPFRTLGRKYPVESLEESLVEGILVGHPGMPEVRMSAADVGAFVAYLKSIQTP